MSQATRTRQHLAYSRDLQSGTKADRLDCQVAWHGPKQHWSNGRSATRLLFIAMGLVLANNAGSCCKTAGMKQQHTAEHQEH